jgi:hypothetical protein
MPETPDKRAKVEIVGDAAKLAGAFGQATRISEQLQKANVFAGLDQAVVPSIAEAFGGKAMRSLIGDMSAIQSAAKAVEGMRPVVAPQIAEELARLTIPNPMPSVAAAFASRLDKTTFNFAKTLGGSYSGALPGIAKMLIEVEPLVRGMTVAIDTPRTFSPTVFTPRVQAAAEEAVAIAEVGDVAEIIDDAVGAIEPMTPARARLLALDLAVLVAALIILAAYLREGGEVVEDPEGAGIALAYAAALVRVSWRVAGKLD